MALNYSISNSQILDEKLFGTALSQTKSFRSINLESSKETDGKKPTEVTKETKFQRLFSMCLNIKLWSFSLCDIVLIMWYLLLQAWVPILYKKATIHEDYKFSAFFFTGVMEFMKLVMSFVLFVACYGCEKLKEGFGSLKWSHWLLYLFSGICYSGVNVLDIKVLEQMDAASAALLSRLRLVTTSILWWLVFKKKLNWIQILAIIGILAGAALLAIKTDQIEKGKMYIKFWGIILIIVQLAFQAAASVYTEWVLKKDRDMSILVQNVGMYTWGFILNMLVYMTWEYDRCYYENPFDFFNGYTYGACVLVAVFGISVAQVLKSMNSIVKMISSTGANLLTALLSFWLLGHKPTTLGYPAMAIIFVSVICYAVGTYYNNKREAEIAELEAKAIASEP